MTNCKYVWFYQRKWHSCFTKRKWHSWWLDWRSQAVKGLQLWSKVQHTQFCRKISYVASYARDEGGGSQKVTNDDEGGGGGQHTPQKWWRHLWTAPNALGFASRIIQPLIKSYIPGTWFSLPDPVRSVVISGLVDIWFIVQPCIWGNCTWCTWYLKYLWDLLYLQT